MADEITPTNPAKTSMKSIGIMLLPFSPVSLDGPDALYGWTRLLVYGAGSALMWKRQKTIAMALAGAAGLSLLSSLSKSALDKGAA